jgi:NAD(P)-dependent dehydrogenase (short-subunit alcohol dehydrogenase family)
VDGALTLVTRTVLVTGGSRGIGAEISRLLASLGFRVAFTYNQNREAAEEAQLSMNSLGMDALAIPMIVEDRKSVSEAVASVRKLWGSIDILVNNAAISQEKQFLAITDDDWDRMLAVNLRGPFACCQECLPSMQQNCWGRIINITSIGGQWGGFNQLHYAASKAGLINLTRSLAKLYSSSGITSNAVSVGLVDTDMSANELATVVGQEKVRSIPSGRIGTLLDVANAVSFLASDSSAYITGQTLNVNGGMFFS